MKRELSRLEIIERSIITTYRPKIWAPFIKACKEYELIKPNDKICVCISGGKDSMLLAKCMMELKKHSDFPFELTYLVMNPGYNKKNLDLILSNLETLGIPAVVKETDIFEIANMQTKSPCYLCAKMRRGALYNLAKGLGCNKIALGHHFDDVIETILMNMLNNGSFQTMLPKLKSDNYEGMELIRPLYYVREKDVKNWAKYNNLEFILCACKLTEGVSRDLLSSKRADTKKLIKELHDNYNDNVEQNIFMASKNINLDKSIGYKKNGKEHIYLEYYDEVEE